MGIVKVNRTNTRIPVYEGSNGSGKIGTIYPNEVFTWIEEWNGSAASGFYSQRICFRNSAGEVDWGWVLLSQNDDELATNICELPYSRVQDGGVNYYCFKMRRTEELYDGNAQPLNKKAYAGRRILCKSSTSGAVNTNWLAVYKLETAVGSGDYDFINGGNVAFVDMGYDQGSTFTSDFSLIGSL